jgi:hypothetical protein
MPIPMMGNTGTLDVLGALSGTPTAMMGVPLGMLANAPATGMKGLPMRGALSSPAAGGISPQMLQLMLSGMKAGAGLMGGKPVNQIMGGVAQDLMPMAMMGQQGMQPGMGGGDPKQEEMMRMMAMLKAKGLLADAEGPITSSRLLKNSIYDAR